MNYFLKFKVNEQDVLECDKVACESYEIPYEKLRSNVDGIIQYVYHVDLGSEKLALVVNEEGLVRSLKPTFWLYNRENMVIEKFPLVGDVLVVRLKGNETVCLSDKDIDLVKSKVMVDFRINKYFLPLNVDYIRRSSKAFNDFFNIINDEK